MNIQVDPTSSNLTSAMLSSNFSSQSSELRHQISWLFKGSYDLMVKKAINFNTVLLKWEV